MLKHGDFSTQDDHRDDQPDRDGRPDEAEYPDVDRGVRRAEFARGPFEETHALAEDEVDHSWCRAACDVMRRLPRIWFCAQRTGNGQNSDGRRGVRGMISARRKSGEIVPT